MSDEFESCATCRFAIPEGDGRAFRCRRFPRTYHSTPLMRDGTANNPEPSVDFMEHCNYPIQQGGDWCGEFAPAKVN